MKILFVGDVVRQAGCDFLRRELPNLRRFYGADMTIVNGENAAEGNGILPGSAELILDAGADVITLGNHALRRREIYPMLEESDRIIRRISTPARRGGAGACMTVPANREWRSSTCRGTTCWKATKMHLTAWTACWGRLTHR